MSKKDRLRRERAVEREAFVSGKLLDRDQRRLRQMASGISSEEMLQVILADVDPQMRDAVEQAIRPYTSIPVPGDEVGPGEGVKPTVN